VKIALLSDIHSNSFALQAVLAEVAAGGPDRVILLGDTFGYYPWAVETWRLIEPLDVFAVLGNHDQLVLDVAPPDPEPVYWDLAKQNERELIEAAPEAITWLRTLSPHAELAVDSRRVLCCHGTPDDPLNGRYYPDNPQDPTGGVAAGEILLLGHTHYPLVRPLAHGGLVINPGSVGQPRDGDLRASWGWLFPQESRFEPVRTEYDVASALKLLTQRGWCKLAIEALRKDYRGRLKSQ